MDLQNLRRMYDTAFELNLNSRNVNSYKKAIQDEIANCKSKYSKFNSFDFDVYDNVDPIHNRVNFECLVENDDHFLQFFVMITSDPQLANKGDKKLIVPTFGTVVVLDGDIDFDDEDDNPINKQIKAKDGQILAAVVYGQYMAAFGAPALKISLDYDLSKTVEDNLKTLIKQTFEMFEPAVK